MENEMNRRLGDRSVIVLSRFGTTRLQGPPISAQFILPSQREHAPGPRPKIPHRESMAHKDLQTLHGYSSSFSPFIDINTKKYAAQTIPSLPFDCRPMIFSLSRQDSGSIY
jgi:hypothetical protein